MTKPAITMDRTGLDTDTTTETKAISNTIDGSREARIESNQQDCRKAETTEQIW